MKTAANGARGKGIFRIIEFSNPSGETAFRVTGWTVDGERIRQNYKTHLEAVARKQKLETEAANLADAGQTVFTRLKPSEVADAEGALGVLRAAGLRDFVIDLGDAGVVRALLANLDAERAAAIADAIGRKDEVEIGDRSVIGVVERVSLRNLVPASPPFAAAFQFGTIMFEIAMTVFMAVPMVAWMIVRRHGWRHSVEMAVGMSAPVAAIVVLRLLRAGAYLP